MGSLRRIPYYHENMKDGSRDIGVSRRRGGKMSKPSYSSPLGTIMHFRKYNIPSTPTTVGHAVLSLDCAAFASTPGFARVIQEGNGFYRKNDSYASTGIKDAHIVLSRGSK